MNKLYVKPEIEVNAFSLQDNIAANDSTTEVPIENDVVILSDGLEFNVNFNGNDEI